MKCQELAPFVDNMAGARKAKPQGVLAAPAVVISQRSSDDLSAPDASDMLMSATDLTSVSSVLSQMTKTLDNACMSLGLAPDVARWVHGCCYELYRLAAACKMTIEPRAFKSQAALGQCVLLSSALTPGSDLHTVTSAALWGVCRDLYGQQHARTREASRATFQVRTNTSVPGCVARTQDVPMTVTPSLICLRAACL